MLASMSDDDGGGSAPPTAAKRPGGAKLAGDELEANQLAGEPPAGEELEVQVHGLRLRARAYGPIGAPPVLALHGWLDNAASFETLAPRLTGYRIVALDCPGHGHSDHAPPAANYNFADWVPLPFSVADALGWERFSLVGHSMGGGIAALSAGALPERIEALVMLDAVGPLTAPEQEAPARMRNHIEARRASARRPPAYRSPEEAVERLARAVPGLSRVGARRLVARGTERVASTGGEAVLRWRADPRLRRPSAVRFTEGQVLAFLTAIRCPVLILQAERGHPFPPSIAAARIEKLAHATVKQLPGAHHMHLCQPELVAPEVQRFLDQHLAGISHDLVPRVR